MRKELIKCRIARMNEAILSQPPESTLLYMNPDGSAVLEPKMGLKEKCLSDIEIVDFTKYMFKETEIPRESRDNLRPFLDGIQRAHNEIKVLQDVISILSESIDPVLTLKSILPEELSPHRLVQDMILSYELKQLHMTKCSDRLSNVYENLQEQLSKLKEWYKYLWEQKKDGWNIIFDPDTKSYYADVSYEKSGSEYQKTKLIELLTPDIFINQINTEIVGNSRNIDDRRLVVDFKYLPNDITPKWINLILPRMKRIISEGLTAERDILFDEETFNEVLKISDYISYPFALLNESSLLIEIFPSLSMEISLSKPEFESILGRIARIHISSRTCIEHKYNYNLNHIPEFPILNHKDDSWLNSLISHILTILRTDAQSLIVDRVGNGVIHIENE
jgi:hypothetical protein